METLDRQEVGDGYSTTERLLRRETALVKLTDTGVRLGLTVISAPSLPRKSAHLSGTTKTKYQASNRTPGCGAGERVMK